MRRYAVISQEHKIATSFGSSFLFVCLDEGTRGNNKHGREEEEWGKEERIHQQWGRKKAANGSRIEEKAAEQGRKKKMSDLIISNVIGKSRDAASRSVFSLHLRICSRVKAIALEKAMVGPRPSKYMHKNLSGPS